MGRTFDQWCTYFQITITARPANTTALVGLVGSGATAGALGGPPGIAIGAIIGFLGGLLITTTVLDYSEVDLAKQLNAPATDAQRKALLVQYLIAKGYSGSF